jgi:hypothetical protein
VVTIRVTKGRLELQAPYHPILPFRSKQIGGKWLGSEIGWVFPLEEEQALRRVCLDIWAVDGSPTSFEKTVELQITVDERARSLNLRRLPEPDLPGRPRDRCLAQESTRGASRPRREVSCGKPALRLLVELMDDHHPQRGSFHHP